MVMGITAVVTGIPLGIAADRYGRKKSLVAGGTLLGLSIVAFAFTTDSTALLLLAAMTGTSQSAFSAAGNALLAEKSGDAKRTLAFSLSSFVSTAGMGLGSFILPVTSILEILGFSDKAAHEMLYAVVGVLCFVSLPLIRKVSESVSTRGSRGAKSILPRKSMGVLARYTLANSIIAFGAGMVVPLMTRWLYLRFGTPDTVSGPILGISNFLVAAAILMVPTLARRFGVVKAIVLTQGISTLFMFLTPFSPDYLVASTVYIVRTFLMNMANPLQQSLIMGLVAKDERGAASGISAALWRLPNSISARIGAGLMGAGLLAEPFHLATLLYIVSITIFWFAFGKMRLPDEMI